MVLVDPDDVVGADRETLEAIAGQKFVDSDEEYREFVREHPLPDGFVWGRSLVGTEEGRWKVHYKEEPEIRGTNTDLEQRLGEHLVQWGYREHFQHDYRHLGYQLDFADTARKVALEPGAAHWHTPKSCRGETGDGIGEAPVDVYWPPMGKDVRKHRSLTDDGWQVLWINEDGLNDEQDAIRGWLAEIYE